MQRSGAQILAAVLLLTSLGACKSNPRLNVILVSIDTLRPDHLDCYGYGRETSPTITRLAREGVLFEKAFSSTSWTLPAHLALLTGLPDLVHGVLTEADRLDERRITLAEVLKGQGYETWGVFTGPFVLPLWGFGQGFDVYHDATKFDRTLEGPYMLRASEKGRTTPGAMDKVEALLSRRSERPFFLFLHLFDAHPDFDPPPPYDTLFDPGYRGQVTGLDIMNNPAVHKDMAPQDLEHLRALYDGEIRFVDEEGIDRLMTLLRTHQLTDRTLVIITSDHGEEFFEHGVFGHRQNLYDTTLRIPLIFWCPGRVPAGVVVNDQVQIIDIMPTILDLLELRPGAESIGQSLVPMFRPGGARPARRPLFAEVKSWTINFEALRTDAWKVIMDQRTGHRALIDMAKDQGEQSPLGESSTPLFQEAVQEFFTVRWNLSNYAKTLFWGDKVSPQIDEELRQRLRSLGYIK